MGEDATMDCHSMMGEGMLSMRDAQIRSEDVAQGVRLIFTPNDPKDLAALRQHAKLHAEAAKSGSCPMHAMHGAPSSPAPVKSASPSAG